VRPTDGNVRYEGRGRVDLLEVAEGALFRSTLFICFILNIVIVDVLIETT
jgi:hypothetical protein